jgi:nucleotide-binding universal stress UspA family protein
MGKPIIAGYDPASADRAPVNFGVAAAEFTGAPLIVGSVRAAGHGPGAGQQDEELLVDTTEVLAEAERERQGAGISFECRWLTGTSAARALHEAAEAVLLGGVTRRLTAEAHCPVIVLPRGVTSSLEALSATAPGAAAR